MNCVRRHYSRVGSAFSTKAFAALALSACVLVRVADVAAQEPASADEARLGRLETGIQAEEAIRAVKRLQNTYSHYLDAGLWNDLADLFTENPTAAFEGTTVTGKDNLRRYLMNRADRKAAGLARGQLNEHLILQPIITLGEDGKTAKGTWHEIAMLGNLGASASWAGGVYENDYVLDKGVWKISVIRFYPQYSGGYDAFGHQAPPKWNIPYHFEAAHVGVTIPRSLLQSTGSSSTSHTLARGQPLARLARRVQRLADEAQVQNLQHSYGYYLDRKMWDDVADLFADDGSLELAQRGVYLGKPHIRHALEVLYGAPPLKTGELFDHINLATVVTIAADGRRAAARTSQLSMLGLNGEYASWEVGTYENELIKHNGVWKLRAVHYYPRMATDYDLGWARDAKPAPGVSKDFPPDRPPTQAFGSYPDIQYVGFHYANPVTGRAVRYPPGPVTRTTIVQGKAANAVSSSDTPASLADVERQLDRAIGFDAVENLNSSYGYYIDESAWDNMADTYAKAGSKEITGVGVYVGPERIRKILNLRGPRGGRTPSFFTIHQLTQPVIDVSADGTHANGRFRLIQGGGNADGSSASWIGGIYENTAEKEDGEWKFGRQELYHIFNASYRNGWARVGGVTHLRSGADKADNPRDEPGGGITQGLGGANSPGKFAADFPPDRAIQVRQYAFPDIVEPPFHYRNPVTGRAPPEWVP